MYNVQSVEPSYPSTFPAVAMGPVTKQPRAVVKRPVKVWAVIVGSVNTSRSSVVIERPVVERNQAIILWSQDRPSVSAYVVLVVVIVKTKREKNSLKKCKKVKNSPDWRVRLTLENLLCMIWWGWSCLPCHHPVCQTMGTTHQACDPGIEIMRDFSRSNQRARARGESGF